MVINTNISASMAANNLSASQDLLTKSLARLSSGSKIVNPADDAAGLAVASRLDTQVQRTNAAKSNVGNAVSFTQVQDGYLKKIGKALERMSELSLLAMDGTKSDEDRALYNNEFTQLAAYIDNAATKDFNGVSLFSTGDLDVTIDSEGNTFTMAGIDLGASAYAAISTAAIDTVANAGTALDAIKTAINALSNDRASIGAYQTRLNFTSDQLAVSAENLMAASSRIQDVNVAEESTRYARAQILVQSATAMLAQANTVPQSALQLLR